MQISAKPTKDSITVVLLSADAKVESIPQLPQLPPVLANHLIFEVKFGDDADFALERKVLDYYFQVLSYDAAEDKLRTSDIGMVPAAGPQGGDDARNAPDSGESKGK